MTETKSGFATYLRLQIAYFLQFAIWGSFGFALTGYAAGTLRWETIGWLGAAVPLGAFIGPLVFGQIAGRLAARVVDGRLSLHDALATYDALVRNRRLTLKYSILGRVERHLQRMPAAAIEATAWYFGAGPLAARCQAAYWRVAPAEWLRPGGVAAPAGPVD